MAEPIREWGALETDGHDGHDCRLCGERIAPDEPAWDVVVSAPGTVYHGEQRWYHEGCWEPNGDDALDVTPVPA